MAFQFDHVAQQVPDIEAAVGWYRSLMPSTRVLYQDATWAMVDACGAKIAFVKRDEHPGHLAWRVSDDELERLAREREKRIVTHRDRTRSFYLEAPGGQAIEVIAYPPEEAARPRE